MPEKDWDEIVFVELIVACENEEESCPVIEYQIKNQLEPFICIQGTIIDRVLIVVFSSNSFDVGMFPLKTCLKETKYSAYAGLLEFKRIDHYEGFIKGNEKSVIDGHGGVMHNKRFSEGMHPVYFSDKIKAIIYEEFLRRWQAYKHSLGDHTTC